MVYKRKIHNDDRNLNKNLLRNLYNIEDYGRADKTANAIYDLFKNNDLVDASFMILSNIVDFRWKNEARGFGKLLNNSLDNITDDKFHTFVERTKRINRGSIVVKNSKMEITNNDGRFKFEVFKDNVKIAEKVEIGRWNIRSHSYKNLFYQVVKKEDGTYICPCPDFKYRANEVGGECKHILEVKRIEKIVNDALNN